MQKSGILISIRRTGDGFHPGLFIQPLFQVQIVRYGICRRREWGMKDLQWILDTAAFAYEKRFMKKNEDIC